MRPDRVSNPGPLTYESAALPIALRGPAPIKFSFFMKHEIFLLRWPTLISVAQRSAHCRHSTL